MILIDLINFNLIARAVSVNTQKKSLIKSYEKKFPS